MLHAANMRLAPPRYSWLRVGCRALLLLYILIIGYSIIKEGGFANSFGHDFLAFWAASQLSLAGHSSAVFDATALGHVARAALPDFTKPLLWHYPPTFQLLVLPLALLPYAASAFLWLASTLLAYLAAMRRLVPHADTLLIAVAFPAVVVNFRIGQNGFLSAALFAGSMALLRTRPVLAGAMIGLLAYKPHLGLLIPVALICARQWTAFFSACVTVLAFVAASTAVLGWETWLTFLNTVPDVGQRLDNAVLKWRIMPSVYVGLRTLGLDAATAYAIHGAVAAIAAVAAAWAWLRRIQFDLAVAVLVCASVLLPPYIFDYDLTLLAIPIMILIADGARHGWRAGERIVLVLAWFAPLASVLKLQQFGIAVSPVLLIALFAIAVRRALASARDVADIADEGGGIGMQRSATGAPGLGRRTG